MLHKQRSIVYPRAPVGAKNQLFNHSPAQRTFTHFNLVQTQSSVLSVCVK